MQTTSITFTPRQIFIIVSALMMYTSSKRRTLLSSLPAETRAAVRNHLEEASELYDAIVTHEKEINYETN